MALLVVLLLDLSALLPAGRKLLRFEQYTSTRLLAQFDEDLPQIQKISMRINTGNVIGPRYKIRLLRVRFTPLDRPERWDRRHLSSTKTRSISQIHCASLSSSQVFDVPL